VVVVYNKGVINAFAVLRDVPPVGALYQFKPMPVAVSVSVPTPHLDAPFELVTCGLVTLILTTFEKEEPPKLQITLSLNHVFAEMVPVPELTGFIAPTIAVHGPPMAGADCHW
jgi:hypothetical protein